MKNLSPSAPGTMMFIVFSSWIQLDVEASIVEQAESFEVVAGAILDVEASVVQLTGRLEVVAGATITNTSVKSIPHL